MFLFPAVTVVSAAEVRPVVEVVGNWRVRVLPGTLRVGGVRYTVRAAVTVDVAPASRMEVRDERHGSLPLYDAHTAGWAKGAHLQALVTAETTAPDLLVRGSVVVKSGPGDAKRYTRGVDYEIDEQWGTFGRLPGGAIGEHQPVWIDYKAGAHRIDSIVVDRAGRVTLREGTPHNATPHPPALGAGEADIANIWVPGLTPKLSADNLYPVLEPVYRAPHHAHPPAETLLPKTWAKLHSDGTLHVLAWGDSVTAGGQASDDAHRFQSRFVTLLRAKYPKATITLTTVGWGGRNSDSFLKEPPSSEYNFDRAVIQPHPDLIIMEFVNDAGMSPEVVEQKYSYLLSRFKEIGAEWIIIGPHFVWPEWMGTKTDRIEADTRPYVAGIRAFAKKHHVALADTGLRWGHLLKEGIPYRTLLVNSLNHPDDRGHEMFAQALMDLF